MTAGNGKVEFIKKQIASAIEKAEKTATAPGVCQVHAETVDVHVLSVRLGEMVLDELLDLGSRIGDCLHMSDVAPLRTDLKNVSDVVSTFVRQRDSIYAIWRFLGVVFGTGGILGVLLLVIELYRVVKGA